MKMFRTNVVVMQLANVNQKLNFGKNRVIYIVLHYTIIGLTNLLRNLIIEPLMSVRQ